MRLAPAGFSTVPTVGSHMSDSDDGFDEDAVREELREKYEDEREDREATARMSDLLLQGATMTNEHCDRCGTPLFRQDGQTFCPNCQHAAQQAQADAAAQGEQAQPPQDQRTQQPQDQHAQPPQEQRGQPPQDQRAQPPQDQPAKDEQTGSRPAAGRTGDRRTPPSQQGDARARTAAGARETATDTSARSDPSTRDLPEHAPTATASGPAGDALESTIAALARRAASADDPRTAREYLEAAREAAEALAALR